MLFAFSAVGSDQNTAGNGRPRGEGRSCWHWSFKSRPSSLEQRFTPILLTFWNYKSRPSSIKARFTPTNKTFWNFKSKPCSLRRPNPDLNQKWPLLEIEIQAKNLPFSGNNCHCDLLVTLWLVILVPSLFHIRFFFFPISLLIIITIWCEYRPCRGINKNVLDFWSWRFSQVQVQSTIICAVSSF